MVTPLTNSVRTTNCWLSVIPDDPVIKRSGDLHNRARIRVAGEPESCSGKANAIITGMEAATHDIKVWTDDDFHHPPDWLDQLKTDYEKQGPTTEIPLFVGRDPLSYLLEVLYAQVSLFIATPAGNWGDALVFDRTEDIDEEALLADLRQIISDDATVNEHVRFTTVQRTRRTFVWGGRRHRWRSMFDVEITEH